jgi:hypothetical protein
MRFFILSQQLSKEMLWLLGVVGVSAYLLYNKSIPVKAMATPPVTGVLTPSVGWQFPRSSTQNANYAVKPGRYQVSAGAMTDVGLPPVAPPTRNGTASKQPFSGQQ